MSAIHDKNGLISALTLIRAQVPKRLYSLTDSPGHDETVALVETNLTECIEAITKLDAFPHLTARNDDNSEAPKAKRAPLVADLDSAYVVTFSPGGEEVLIKTRSSHEASAIADEIAHNHKLKTNGADFRKATREDIDGRTFKARYLEVRI